MKKPPPLSDLVLLQNMCLEREMRFDQRIAEAEARGDSVQAERERQLKARFTAMKNQVLSDIIAAQAAGGVEGALADTARSLPSDRAQRFAEFLLLPRR